MSTWHILKLALSNARGGTAPDLVITVLAWLARIAAHVRRASLII